MAGTEYWRAPEVEVIANQLIVEHHDHLNRTDVTIKCVFRHPTAKSKGRLVLGKARKIGGLTAHLVGLEHAERLSEDEPVDFFVIEIAHEPWQGLTPAQRVALVDHELCHLDVELSDDDEDRKLLMRGHDLEEFTEVVARHGLWRPVVKIFAETASQQLKLPLQPGSAGDVLRHGSGVLLGKPGGDAE